MNFDEFRAAIKREQSKEGLLQELKGEKQNIPTKSPPNLLGSFLEMYQMQTFLIVMILFDTLVSFLEIFLLSQREYFSEINASFPDFISRFNVALDALKAITTFNLYFFGVEILAILFVFGLSTLGHYGYLLDSVIIGGQIYLGFHGAGRETRLLNFFRLWRLMRLLTAMVNVEKELHEETKEKLIVTSEALQKCEREIKVLESDIIKERGARDAVEQMLQGYKEEVDTLNEALKIAAMDIAEVAQADDDFIPTDDEDEEEGSVEVFMDAVSTEPEKLRNKEVLYREARRDGAERKAKGGGTTTFLVHEDGTFEKR